MLSLTRPNVYPPGGFSYTQPETGQKFVGNDPLKAQGKKVEAHRKANHLPRATLIESMEDIIAAVCARHPPICTDLAAPKNFSVKTPSRPKVSAMAQAPVNGTAGPTPAVRIVKKCGSCGGRKAKT